MERAGRLIGASEQARIVLTVGAFQLLAFATVMSVCYAAVPALFHLVYPVVHLRPQRRGLRHSYAVSSRTETRERSTGVMSDCCTINHGVQLGSVALTDGARMLVGVHGEVPQEKDSRNGRTWGLS